MSSIRKPADLVGGVLMMLIAAFAFAVTRDLPMGSARNMGSGWFPTVVALMLGGLGAMIVFNAMRGARAAFDEWARLLLLVAATVVLVAVYFKIDPIICLLAAIGFAVARFVRPDVSWLQTLLILAAILFFAPALSLLGLILAAAGLLLIAAAAAADFDIREALIVAVCMSVGAYALFVEALGLALSPWPSFLR